MPLAQNKLIREVWLITAVLVTAPYIQGLFFQQEWLFVQFFAGLCLILALFKIKKSATVLFDYVDLAAGALLAAYIISAITAVNAQTGIDEVLRLLTLFATYRLVRYGGWDKYQFNFLLSALFWSGVGVGVLGLGAALGLVHLSGAYLNGRVYSTFQYPNTLAAYLGYLMFLGVYLWQQSSGYKKRWYAPSLIVLAACLLATGSRGGIAAFLLCWPILLLLLPSGSRFEFLARMLIVTLAGFVTAGIMLHYLVQNNNIAAGIALTLGPVLGIICADFLEVYHRKHWKLAGQALLVTVIVTGLLYGLHVPGQSALTHLRLDLYPHSFQERLSYYIDGFKMLLKRPVQGFGGGGWALYKRWQSYPYQTSDPHSEIIKVAVESGLVGLICYLGWWIFFLRRVWFKTRQGDIQAAVLTAGILVFAIHSLVDFDLSYGSVALMVWISMAVVLAYSPGNESGFTLILPVRFLLVGFAAMILMIGSFLELRAISEFNRSLTDLQQSNEVSAITHLNLARTLDPFDSTYPAQQAAIYSAKGQAYNLPLAEKNIKEALRLNSTDAQIKDEASRIYLAAGRIQQAVVQAEDAWSFRTFNQAAYIGLADFYRQAAGKALAMGNKSLAKQCLLHGSQLTERWQARMASMPKRAIQLWSVPTGQTSGQLQQRCREMAVMLHDL